MGHSVPLRNVVSVGAELAIDDEALRLLDLPLDLLRLQDSGRRRKAQHAVAAFAVEVLEGGIGSQDVTLCHVFGLGGVMPCVHEIEDLTFLGGFLEDARSLVQELHPKQILAVLHV